MQNGTVVESQCDCPAGMGPESVCSHRVLVLFAVAQHTLNKPIKTKKSKTEQLQQFHTSKPHRGSPIKADKLPLGVKRIVQDPRPLDCRNRPEYPAHFRNTILNAPGSSSWPISTLYEVASIKDVEQDHDYCRLTISENFLIRNCLETISTELVEVSRAICINNIIYL